MKNLIAVGAASLAFAFASPALAEHHMTKEGFEVVETNAKGQATKVSKDGQTYAVCMGDNQDSCINPREAGLKWGNRPLSYWPGKPASQIDEPLPAEQPSN